MFSNHDPYEGHISTRINQAYWNTGLKAVLSFSVKHLKLHNHGTKPNSKYNIGINNQYHKTRIITQISGRNKSIIHLQQHTPCVCMQEYSPKTDINTRHKIKTYEGSVNKPKVSNFNKESEILKLGSKKTWYTFFFSFFWK